MAKRKGHLQPPSLTRGLGRYTLVLAQDDDGRWNAQVKEVLGALTWGTSISQCRTRIREALALFVDDAETAEVIDEIHASKRVRTLVRRLEQQRRRADEELQRTHELQREVARELLKTMTTRDAAAILGLSQARIAQLVEHHD